MKRAWQAWVDLLSARERGTTLASFRVAVALVILYSLLSVAAVGLVEVLWVDAAYGGYRRLAAEHWLWDALGGPTPRATWTLWWISLAAAVAMALGVAGRVPIAVLVLAYPTVAMVNGDASGGYDLLIANALWLLLLGQATATLSVDCRRKTGAWTDDVQIAAWPRYLAVFQLIIVYTATGLHKLSADWVPGGSHSALYWVFQEPTWNRFDLRRLSAELYPLTQLGTIATWLWEVGTVGLLWVFWFRYTADRPGRLRKMFNRYDLRKVWAGVGVGLHLSILIVFNVGPFSWISLAYYLCLWTPAELERWIPGGSGRGAAPSRR